MILNKILIEEDIDYNITEFHNNYYNQSELRCYMKNIFYFIGEPNFE